MFRRVGLCASCKHVRRITSDHGSVFYLCMLSAVDPRFPKYPRPPVLSGSGYEGDEKFAVLMLGIDSSQEPRLCHKRGEQ